MQLRAAWSRPVVADAEPEQVHEVDPVGAQPVGGVRLHPQRQRRLIERRAQLLAAGPEQPGGVDPAAGAGGPQQLRHLLVNAAAWEQGRLEQQMLDPDRLQQGGDDLAAHGRSGRDHRHLHVLGQLRDVAVLCHLDVPAVGFVGDQRAGMLTCLRIGVDEVGPVRDPLVHDGLQVPGADPSDPDDRDLDGSLEVQAFGGCGCTAELATVSRRWAGRACPAGYATSSPPVAGD